MRTCFLLYVVLLLATILFMFVDLTEGRRNAMVDNQIINRGVSDPQVIRAMREVPRHLFVPKESQKFAYEDRPLPIGFNQYMSQPYIVAFMTAAVGLTGYERVLEIGTGSGYQAAILAEITNEVYTIEIVKGLAWRAEKRLKDLGYKNIVVKHGNEYKGIREFAPYDAIVVTTALEEIPKELVRQLKVGGRMVISVAPNNSFTQDFYLITRNQDSITKKLLLKVPIIPMVKEK